MSKTSVLTSIGALALLVLVSSSRAARAQNSTQRPSHAAASVRAGLPESRVRALDREARQVIERAVTSSPTVARLIAELERSDLIVGVQLCPLSKKLLGEARIVTATPDVRHVRIRIKIPNALDDLVSVLGHELQHARELAAAPDVRDAVAQTRLFRRIGYERHSGGFFETEAALEAGRSVASEIRHASSK